MAGIYLGVPTYNGWMTAGCAQAVYGCPSHVHHVITTSQGGSLLCGNCNRLLSMALNQQRESDLQWFALLHADITPEPFFLDKLVAEAELHNADMMSVPIAIKNTLGVTSTAICSGKRFGQYGRLTFAQLRHPQFPKTFDIDDAADALAEIPPPIGATIPRHALLANTGCMIVRLDRPWSRKLVFRTFDAMYEVDGQLQPRDLSEDWYFSWLVAKLGGKVMCTTLVSAVHRGEFEYPNNRDWPHGVPNECGVERQVTREIKSVVRSRKAVVS